MISLLVADHDARRRGVETGTESAEILRRRLEVLKQLLPELPEHNRLRQSQSLYPIAHWAEGEARDVRLADTFLHPQDASYTVSDVVEWVRGAAMRVNAWPDESTYAVKFAHPLLRRHYEVMPLEDRLALGELFHGNVLGHRVVVVHADNPTRSWWDGRNRGRGGDGGSGSGKGGEGDEASPRPRPPSSHTTMTGSRVDDGRDRRNRGGRGSRGGRGDSGVSYDDEDNRRDDGAMDGTTKADLLPSDGAVGAATRLTGSSVLCQPFAGYGLSHPANLIPEGGGGGGGVGGGGGLSPLQRSIHRLSDCRRDLCAVYRYLSVCRPWDLTGGIDMDEGGEAKSVKERAESGRGDRGGSLLGSSASVAVPFGLFLGNATAMLQVLRHPHRRQLFLQRWHGQGADRSTVEGEQEGGQAGGQEGGHKEDGLPLLDSHDRQTCAIFQSADTDFRQGGAGATARASHGRDHSPHGRHHTVQRGWRACEVSLAVLDGGGSGGGAEVGHCGHLGITLRAHRQSVAVVGVSRQVRAVLRSNDDEEEGTAAGEGCSVAGASCAEEGHGASTSAAAEGRGTGNPLDPWHPGIAVGDLIRAVNGVEITPCMFSDVVDMVAVAVAADQRVGGASGGGQRRCHGVVRLGLWRRET